jgi:inhibitor of the pro-sigma K processing machinery
MVIFVIFALVGIAVGLVSLLWSLLKKPLGLALKIFLHALSGFVFLFIFNILGSYLGGSLGLNWVNAIVTGVLGVPGVVLLLLIKYLL